jgi:hypothetical protein
MSDDSDRDSIPIENIIEHDICIDKFNELYSVKQIYSVLKKNYIDIKKSGSEQKEDYFGYRRLNGTDLSDEISNLFRLLHNYLASLYSFHESISDYISSRFDICKSNVININQTPYTIRLSYLRGLRNYIQHNGFNCFGKSEIGNMVTIKLKKDKFIEDMSGNPSRFLKHTTKKNGGYHHEKPFSYIDKFHNKFILNLEL